MKNLKTDNTNRKATDPLSLFLAAAVIMSSLFVGSLLFTAPNDPIFNDETSKDPVVDRIDFLMLDGRILASRVTGGRKALGPHNQADKCTGKKTSLDPTDFGLVKKERRRTRTNTIYAPAEKSCMIRDRILATGKIPLESFLNQ